MVDTFTPLPALSLMLSSLILAIPPAPHFLPSTTADSGFFYIVGDTSLVKSMYPKLKWQLSRDAVSLLLYGLFNTDASCA